MIKCHNCKKDIKDEIIYNKRNGGTPFCSIDCLKQTTLDNLDIRTCPTDEWYGDEE
ncbi:MAG: hypothetical protein Q8O88_00810 [bacterium]|nr:hypothetical protein [bacterium]